MKARDLERVLRRRPLNYRIDRQKGSHRVLVAADYGSVLFSFHDSDTVPPGLVRKILVQDVGLSEDEALSLLRRGG